MTSESKYGSARNSLVWLGVAKSTHRASERVRGSGRGLALQGLALQGVVGYGNASHTASVRGCGREARRGMAGHGGVRRCKANTQRLTGRCSLLGAARRGAAWQGLARQGKHTAAFRSRCSLFGAAWRYMARLGRPRHGKHAALLRKRGSLLGAARRGKARRGKAGQGKHTAAHGPLQFARQGPARLGKARRGTIIRLITGQFYDRHRKPNR